MKLKCWRGNFDGVREACVITTSQKRAAEILGMSLHGFRGYFCTTDDHPIGLEPNTMYTRRLYGQRLKDGRIATLAEPWRKGLCL